VTQLVTAVFLALKSRLLSLHAHNHNRRFANICLVALFY
jgi:hypothetical protein